MSIVIVAFISLNFDTFFISNFTFTNLFEAPEVRYTLVMFDSYDFILTNILSNRFLNVFSIGFHRMFIETQELSKHEIFVRVCLN